MKKESIHFEKNINAGERKVFSERIKANGFINRVAIRFYSGQERDLKVHPFVKVKGSQAVEEIITYPEGTENSLSGNDDYFVHELSVPVRYDDEFIIVVENTTASGNIYTLVCDVSITYVEGV